MNLENISIGNAAGTIKTMLEVEKACARNAMTAITVGSVTLKPKEGNIKDKGAGRVYYYDVNGGWSLNALGLPNMGFEEYLKQFRDMSTRIHAAGKEFHVSIAGETPEEYADMAAECYNQGIDRVELNLGCPNEWGSDGTQKPIPSYHPEVARRILLIVRSKLPAGRKVDVKISPVEHAHTLRVLAEMFGDVHCVGNVVGTNTIPNQERLGYDGNPALSFNDGNHLGGLAGSALYTESLRVHRKMREHLPKSVGYVAVGGLSRGGGVYTHLKLGAVGFRSGTGYYEEGPRVFTPILKELSEVVEQPA